MLPLPLVAGGGGEQWLVRMPIAYLIHLSVSLPLTSFLFCISWSLLFNFEASTATHCGVQNLLPSISAAIGDFTPQRYVWRSLLGLHATPRLLVALAYLRRYRSHPPGTTGAAGPLPLTLNRSGGGGRGGRRDDDGRWLLMIAFAANYAEIAGLMVLTNVSSNENHVKAALACGCAALHKLGFTVFVACAACHMLLTCRLWSHAVSDEERRSFLWKRRLAATNLMCCILAVYVYVRHNRYCEPGVYTVFALCEYAVVLTNIAFHWTAAWDFSSSHLLVGPQPPDKHY